MSAGRTSEAAAGMVGARDFQAADDICDLIMVRTNFCDG